MLIVLGDSFSYGYNFSNEERDESVYATKLGEKLKLDVINLSAPGGSNWRIARLIETTNIVKEDIVIISWTYLGRFELGVSKNHFVPPSKRIGDLLEQHENITTKKFFVQLIDGTTDKQAKNLAEIVYNHFYEPEWFKVMFKIMFNSCVYKLEKIGCKWLMFNALTNESENNNIKHKNYIFSDKTMSEVLNKRDVGYWNKEEHIKISNILYEKLKEIYG